MLPKRTKLSKAIAAALAAFSGSMSAQAQIEEIVVTATKRAQSAQDIPVTVQALDSETIRNLFIVNFDDYVRQVPNITSGGRGPGQSEIYIRGMAVDPITVLVSGAQGSMPNVAFYLDEQPVTFPGRNLDVYTADLERIEVLPGPQGTLFGASSQAGTIRLITRKPVMNQFETGVEMGVASTKYGDPSSSLEAYLNWPLINDRLAARGVFYSSRRGGYIDNVPGLFTPDPTINETLPVDANYTTADNSDLVETNFNDSSYEGFRLSAEYFLNDEWGLYLQHMRQTLEVDGVFDHDPTVGDLQVERYYADQLEDKFDQTAWTLTGRIAALDLLYTGAYLDRDVKQFVDYTGYNNVGGFIAYYTCTYTNPAYIVNYGIDPSLITSIRECLNPVKGFRGQQQVTRKTHEFRVTTSDEAPIRAVGGVFLDDLKIETQDDWFYLATPDLGFAPNAPISTANNINPNTRPSGVAFFNDITRSESQLAVFGEVEFDLSDAFTATMGLRWYDLEVDFSGSSNFGDGIFQGSVNTDRGRDYDSTFGHSTEPLKESDVIPKFTLSYLTTGGNLIYGTYSEGFRPGGFNRGGGAPSFNASFPTVPVTYETDNVKNIELGWKTTILDGTLQFNGAAYSIDWTSMQVPRFDPINVSILTFIDNAADAEILGIEADVVWAATENLSLFGAVSYNDTELVATNSEVIEMAPLGSELALTPPIQATARARYNFTIGSVGAYWQAGIQYADRSFSSIVAADRREQESYTIANVAFGLEKNSWSVDLYIENLTDERAQLFFNTQDDVPRVTTNRPRTIGLRFSYGI
jgi:outer membrane receptor protein involved in Fe transport